MLHYFEVGAVGKEHITIIASEHSCSELAHVQWYSA